MASKRSFWITAAVLWLVALLVRLRTLVPGWFFDDDLAALGRTFRQTPAQAISYGEGGHVAYLMNAWSWTVWRVARDDWPLHVADVLLKWSLVGGLLLWLLVRIFGRAPGTLACWAFYLLGSILTPTILWYSQANLIHGVLLPSVIAAHLYLSYLKGGSKRWLLGLAGFFVLSLLAHERNLVLIPVMLASVRVAVWGRRVRQDVVVGAMVALIGAVYVLLYTTKSDAAYRRSAELAEFPRLLARGFFGVWAPSMAGGPWQVDQSRVLARAVVEGWSTAAACAFLIAVVVLAVARSGWRGLAATALVVGLGAVEVLLVVLGRYTDLGDLALREVRYYSQVAIVAPLALATMFVRPRAPGLAAGVEGPTRSKAFERMATRSLVVLSGIWLVGVAVNTVAMAQRWEANDAREFFGRILAESQPQSQTLVDRTAPPNVMNPVLTSEALVSWVLSGVDPAPNFSRPSTDLRIIADDGQLLPAEVPEASLGSPVGPEPGCGYRIGAEATYVPLVAGSYGWDWQVQIEHSATDRLSLPVQIDGQRSIVELRPGAKAWVPHVGPVKGATLGPLPDGRSVCVQTLRVGIPVPSLKPVS